MTDGYMGWKGWQGTDFGRCCAEDALYYEQELHASGIPSVLGLRIGELGYGNGTFAGWVQRAGGQWVGREAIAELQHRAAGAGFEVIPSTEEFSHACGPGTFDLLAAFDVLEHLGLDAIRAFLGEAKEALKPEGLLLVRLPSGDSPFSQAIFRGDLTHRTLLGSGAIRQLALETGFELSQVRSPVLPLWGLGPQRAARRMAVRGLQALVFSFIRQVLMGQGSAVISPNMMVVLRKEAVTL